MTKGPDQLFGRMRDRADAEVFERDGITGVLIRWGMKGIGFGELSIVRLADGVWTVDDEDMGSESVAKILRMAFAPKEPTP